MRTTNKRRYESLKQLLALGEQYKEPLEAMPLGKAFLDQLRQSVGNGADYFKGEKLEKQVFIPHVLIDATNVEEKMPKN